MKIFKESTLRDFDAWSGAVSTKSIILDAGKDEEFEQLIEEIYPEGIDETHLNDILWFESDWCLSSLGISENEEEDIFDYEDDEEEDDEDDDEEDDDYYDFDDWLEHQPEGTFVQGGGIDREARQ